MVIRFNDWENRLAGKPARWWSPFVLLLPYLEQRALYQQILDDPGNAGMGGIDSPGATLLAVMVCPSDFGPASFPARVSGSRVYGWNSYRASAGQGYPGDGVIVTLQSCVKLTDITDGTSNTILFASRIAHREERDGAYLSRLARAAGRGPRPASGGWAFCSPRLFD